MLQEEQKGIFPDQGINGEILGDRFVKAYKCKPSNRSNFCDYFKGLLQSVSTAVYLMRHGAKTPYPNL